MAYIEIQLPNIKIAKEHLKKYSYLNNINDYEKYKEKEEEFKDIIKWSFYNDYKDYINSVGISKKEPLTKSIKLNQIILIIELDKPFNDGYEDFIEFVKCLVKNIYKNEGSFFAIYHIYNTDLYYKWFN